jgi:thymidine kinase
MTGKIHFNYGVMGSGKSLLAIQTGMERSAHSPVFFFTGGDRGGELRITSRLGVEQECMPRENYYTFLGIGGDMSATLIFDEAQFIDPDEVKELQRLSLLGANIHAFGLLRDYRGSMFRGTRAWMEVADVINHLPMPVSCWCGEPATHHGKVVNGQLSYSGTGIAIGDLSGVSGSSGATYVTLCRVHWTYGKWNGVA